MDLNEWRAFLPRVAAPTRTLNLNHIVGRHCIHNTCDHRRHHRTCLRSRETARQILGLEKERRHVGVLCVCVRSDQHQSAIVSQDHHHLSLWNSFPAGEEPQLQVSDKDGIGRTTPTSYLSYFCHHLPESPLCKHCVWSPRARERNRRIPSCTV